MSNIPLITSSSDTIDPSFLYFNDNFEKKQWYLDGSNLSSLSIDVYSVWNDYNGAGVKIGVLDSQIDFRHQDLASAYSSDLDYNFALGTGDVAIDPNNLPYYHGTAVAGIISAQGGNGVGTVGIASGATLVGLGIDYSTSGVINQILAGFEASINLDVVNNSWTFSQNLADDFRKNPEYGAALEHAVSQGRGGLGTNIVFAAGNVGYSGSSNYHNFQNSPYTIAVGAVDPDGNPSSFTSVGSNVLISAAGRDVFTTTLSDRYTSVSGTSFAAPAVSGVIALMLQANPNLGYRDVQEILAYSAQREGLTDKALIGDGWRTNGATNFNGGGLHYSDAFGYGFLNAHDAVRLAETWTQQQTFDNRVSLTKTVALADQLVAGSNDHISVAIQVDQAIDIEHVQLSMDLRWLSTGDLDVYLVSPDGTSVRLVYDLPYEERVGSIRDFTFTSVASLGEQSAGTWTLEIYNRNPEAVDKYGNPMIGKLDGVTLTVSGGAASPDDTYIYTDEFGTLYSGEDLSARSHLSDANGGTDAINAAAVTTNSVIDLSGGAQSLIAGVAVTLDPANIENAYSGDGNDTLIGSNAANMLHAGRGDDVIYFSFGDDTIDGGAGSDSLRVDAAFGSISGSVTATGALAISVHAGEVTQITNVETFVFSDVTYSYAQLVETFAQEPATPGETSEQPDVPTDVPGSTPPTDDTPATSAPETIATVPFDETARSYTGSFTGTGLADKFSGGVSGDNAHGLEGDDVLKGKAGDDALYGDAGNDRLEGDEGSDYLHGGAGDDKLFGDDGNDMLIGGAGDDQLRGGFGDDWIVGEAGSDRMWGDEGADTFVFDVSNLDAVDMIFDFNAAQGDRILITGMTGNTDATFDFVTRGTSTYLEMHLGADVYDIARIKGEGLDTLSLQASESAMLWA